MVVSPFGFLEMQVEGVSGQALELCQPDLCQPPEALDAVDVDSSFAELIPGMIDAEVTVAEIDEPVVAAPAIGVDDGTGVHPAADDALQGRPRAVRDNLCVDLALALEDAEDDGLAVGAAPASALDPARPEEALVDLDDTEQGALRFAGKQNAFAQASVEAIDGVAVQTAQRGRLESGQIGSEVPNQLADLALRDPRTPRVLVFHCHA